MPRVLPREEVSYPGSRASPVHETLSPAKGENPWTRRPVDSVATASASTWERASIAAAGNQRPGRLWGEIGASRLLLGAEAGSLEIQSGGRPRARLRLQPAGCLFHLRVSRLNVLAIIIVSIFGGKARGSLIYCYLSVKSSGSGWSLSPLSLR